LSLRAGNARQHCWTLLSFMRSRSTSYFHQIPFLAFFPQRSKNARFQNFLFGSDPVFQVSSFDLSVLVVELLRTHAYLSFQQFHHQFLPFASSSYAIHYLHPTIYLSTNIVDGEVLKGDEEGGY